MKAANSAPVFACLYPGLCDVARAHGYALAVHGSVATDLDLIAIPWTDEAVSADEVKDALMAHIGACGYSDLLRRDGLPEDQVQQIMARKESRLLDGSEVKPHGRRSWNLYMGAGMKVDLSVMPATKEAKP